MSDRDAFRAQQQERRQFGLKARHETREARAVRKQVAEEIALAIQAHRDTFTADSAIETELYVAEEIAREIGSRDPE